MEKKNVCLLIYDLRSGGAERVLSQWSQLLSDKYNVFLTLFNPTVEIAYSYGGELCYLDAPSNNSNFLTKVNIVTKRAKLLKKFVARNNIDIVISFCNECNLVNTISNHNALKICSIRAASDLNANRFVEYVVRSKRNKIIIQTEALKRTMIERYGEGIAHKLIVFGNPFNCDVIRKNSQDALPDNIGLIMNSKKTIVHVGSYKPQKNHANLLRTFELVCDSVKDVYLLLVGADSVGLNNAVKGMAKKSRYSDRIFFVGELRNPFPVMKNGTLFVLPSLSEGIPNVLAEAMICGSPVIASNCQTGPEELLTKSGEEVVYNEKGWYLAQYGILVKPFSKAAEFNYESYSEENRFFADAIIYALGNNENLKELKRRALEGADRFDLCKYQMELISLIECELKE